MLINDIEYVKTHVPSSLPELLNFSNVIAKMIENFPSDDFTQIKVTLERVIQRAEREMNDVIKLIFEGVIDLIGQTLQTMVIAYYDDVKRGRPNVR